MVSRKALVFDSIKDYWSQRNLLGDNPVSILLKRGQGAVDFAEPYRCGAMHYSSKKPASGMLIGQYNFPAVYDKVRDTITSAYSDRVYSWDYEHSNKIVEKYKAGDIEKLIASSDDETILNYFVELLKLDKEEEPVTWTGWRVVGYVNQSNGFPVYRYDVFSKHTDSNTEVYTGHRAPNVYPSVSIQDMGLVVYSNEFWRRDIHYINPK